MTRKGTKQSEETRTRISKALKGKKKPKGFGEKVSAGLKNSKAFQARCAKQRGVPRPPEVVEKVRKAITGRHHTEETRKKISEIQRGKKRNLSEETRNRMRVRMLGNTYGCGNHMSEENKRKASERHKGNQYNLGRKQSKEEVERRKKSVAEFWESDRGSERRKIVSALHKGNTYGKGRKMPEYQKQAIIKACTGRVKSKEEIEKIRKANLGRKMSSESRARMSAHWRGKKHTEAHKESISIGMARACTEGRNKPYRFYETGEFYSEKLGKQVYYRSSYEYAAIQLLENDIQVISYQPEPEFLRYEYNGRALRYVPDFCVDYVGGDWKFLEIKPKNLLHEPKTQAKLSAAYIYYGGHFEVWTEKELGIV